MATKVTFLWALALVAALALMGVVTPLRADSIGIGSSSTSDPFTLNFDEVGNGAISINGAAFIPLQGALRPDPSGSGIPLALTYFLPETVINGDVLITNLAEDFLGLGDVIRFTDAAGHLTGATADRLIYYSDSFNGQEPGDLADVPPQGCSVPCGVRNAVSNLGSGATATTTENGTEEANGFTYAPGGNMYSGISDGSLAPVPEPASLTLLGSGLLALWGGRKRGRRT